MRVSYKARLVATGLVVAGLSIAGARSLIAQAKSADKSDQTQRAETQATIALVDDLATGKPAVATLPIKWEHQDYIKAQAEKTYVPFTIAIEPGALTTSGVSMYLRVVKKGADAGPPPAPAKPEKENKKDKDKAPLVSAQSSYPFENLYLIDTPAPAVATQPVRVSRAFSVAPGEYRRVSGRTASMARRFWRLLRREPLRRPHRPLRGRRRRHQPRVPRLV